jgi:hypothetical protein
MDNIPKQLTWQEKVIQVADFHKEKVKKNGTHGIIATGRMLNRAYGAVQEDIMIMDWYRTYPKLLDFDTRQEAVNWIRAKKKEIRSR